MTLQQIARSPEQHEEWIGRIKTQVVPDLWEKPACDIHGQLYSLRWRTRSTSVRRQAEEVMEDLATAVAAAEDVLEENQ